jgi:Zn-dependent peptidase ImmA (M78 family)/transcriptional regulator with XRE-family HTH domain
VSEGIYIAAHLFDAGRLTLARELRGLTKAELADRIGKSASAVSQFEGGRARPDPMTLKRIGLVLAVPVEFFAQRNGRTSLISLDACHFRSLRSASQRARRQLLAQATLLNELVGILETEVDFVQEQVTRVSRTVSNLSEIEECAAAVRREWGLGNGPITNVVRLLENKGVMVLPIAVRCLEVDAFSMWHAGRPYMFLVMDKNSPSRTRFDAAHELGHLVMHHDVVPGNPEAERQAHQFAAAFLMPQESFAVECPRRLSMPHFRELKARWKVSLAAMIRRAHDLGHLSEASYRRGYAMLGQSGERVHERDEPPPEEPRMLAEAIRIVASDLPPDKLAEGLGLAPTSLRELLGTGSGDAVLSEPPA